MNLQTTDGRVSGEIGIAKVFGTNGCGSGGYGGDKDPISMSSGR